MTRYHLMGLGLAGAIAVAALFSPHTAEGLGFATAMVTGIFGHAQGNRGGKGSNAPRE